MRTIYDYILGICIGQEAEQKFILNLILKSQNNTSHSFKIYGHQLLILMTLNYIVHVNQCQHQQTLGQHLV